MCSFLIFNWLVENIDFVNFFLKFRGPDNTNTLTYKNFIFLHNLLHLTGEKTLQPFFDKENEIITLFNGEIYNYKEFGDYKSDGYCIIDSYKKHGKTFTQKFDGEFSVVLFDFKKNIFILSTDVFSTKPLWYSIDNGKLGISSYESGLTRSGLNNRIKLNPNTIKIFDISTLNVLETHRVFKFDFKQHKNHYNDWCSAFMKSVEKRVNNDNYDKYVCLSSGYDSGAICTALNQLKKKFHTYTIIATENIDIVNKRIEINKDLSNADHTIIDFTKKEFNNIKNNIKENAEKFKYSNKTLGKAGEEKFVTDDEASVGMSKICRLASQKKMRIYLSGSGADEIHSDYGLYGKKIFPHSCFGGKWTDNLKELLSNNPEDNMIWKSFYHGTQKDYLAKEEIISGLHGIEGRYPFLDKYVVQEFLWLSKDLKNNIYKAPLDYFMSSCNYPFDKEKKIGFSAGANLRS